MEIEEEMGRVWAIDIETMGLMSTKNPLPAITCVCLYNGITEHSLLFYNPLMNKDQEAPLIKQNKELLFSILDSASLIVGFNVILFDLEYIKFFFGASQKQLSQWIQKTIDPFLVIKCVLHQTCSLNQLLAMNGMPIKSGSGLQAVLWAKEVYGNRLEWLFFCLA